MHPTKNYRVLKKQNLLDQLSLYQMLFLKILQTIIHYGLHFVFPVVIAKKCYKKQWLKIYCILLATMLVDLDHLLADHISSCYCKRIALYE